LEQAVDSFFRARVFLAFTALSVTSGFLAFATATKSVAETGQRPVTRISAKLPAQDLIGTSADPMDTMGSGAETQNGTSAPAFVTSGT
jgi:hypothetical protein